MNSIPLACPKDDDICSYADDRVIHSWDKNDVELKNSYFAKCPKKQVLR